MPAKAAVAVARALEFDRDFQHSWCDFPLAEHSPLVLNEGSLLEARLAAGVSSSAPVRAASRAGGRHSRGGSSQAASDHYHILVVDDSLTVRMDLLEAFHDAGMQVVTGATVREAKDLMVRQAIGVVILDIRLPDGDGIELLRDVRRSQGPTDLPIMLVTSDDSESTRYRGMAAGANDFVAKPYDRAWLTRRTAELLKLKRVSYTPMGRDWRRRFTILCVDDSPTYLNAVASTLRGEGYVVVEADSGARALRRMSEVHVDCVLLDLEMPGISGKETCRRIRLDARWENIPIIILTALDAHAAMVEGVQTGANDYVVKSSDFRLLKERVDNHLRRRRLYEAFHQVRDPGQKNS